MPGLIPTVSPRLCAPARRAGSPRSDTRRTLILGGGLLLAHLARADEPDDLHDVLRAGPVTRLTPPGGTLTVAIDDGIASAQRPLIFRWIERAAQAVVRYFGRFPVEHAGLVVMPASGARVGHGTTYGDGGSVIRVSVGHAADQAAFDDDWVLTHEMVHLAFPTMARRHLWIEEGTATYVEPIARAQAGQLPTARVWSDLQRGLPQGLPQPGDEGLDRTHTWGRTYWGGALFCLLADIEYRRRSANRVGLQQALRGIDRASGGNTAVWTMDEACKAGDDACGLAVLAPLYAQQRETPVAVDLDALFASLGVLGSGAALRLTDDAPLSAIRRAITESA